MSTHPPPYSTIAPDRLIYEVRFTTDGVPRQAIVTNTISYPLPAEWWQLTCNHATQYDPKFCYLYKNLENEGSLLCLNVHNNAVLLLDGR